MEGTVKWFSAEKGYGFVESAGKEYFLHYSEINGDGFKTVVAGETVAFSAAPSPKGPLAKNVMRLL